MIIQRKNYLNQLLEGFDNGLVKVVTGGRRCGKSFLLFTLFHDYLVANVTDEAHIIELSLDDRRNIRLRNPDALLDYIDSQIQKDGKKNFVILDEIQFVDDFTSVILSLMHMKNLEIYVSGSNSKFLSKDVATEFRGRGDEIRVWPLSFAEFFEARGGDKMEAWQEYYTYGGLPQVMLLDSEQKKKDYLKNLYELTYFNDIVEHNHLRNTRGMRQLIQLLASGIGSPTNPKRISNTFLSKENKSIGHNTVRDYISYLQDAFLIEEALRYDVKGRKYIGTETKYYFSDLGLRNIILNLRQQEEPHIMENIIYNELRLRGFSVDVGFIESWNKNNGKSERLGLEVDFVVNRGAERMYIQSAFRLPTEEKKVQEERPFLNINDNFKKIIITGDSIKRKTDEKGIVTMGLFDFLLDENSI